MRKILCNREIKVPNTELALHQQSSTQYKEEMISYLENHNSHTPKAAKLKGNSVSLE